MFEERIFDTNIGYIYTKSKLNLCGEEYDVISFERIGEVCVYKLQYKEILKKKREKKKNFVFYCKHNIMIDIERYNKLPHDNWEELIDAWSCHKNEFDNVKTFAIRACKQRVLLSDFYGLFHVTDIPICCRKECTDELQKIFLNELNLSISNNSIIYAFFKEYFETYNKFTVCLKDGIYSVMILCECKYVTENKEEYDAIKIGYKKIEKGENVTEINEFYMDAIKNMLETNKLGISINKHEITYIINN